MTGINEFKVAINQMLKKEFPNINIYDKDLKQGFDKPCFFIKVLSSSQIKEINRRYKKSISFDINYFRDEGNVNLDYAYIVDKLYEIFHYLKVDESLYRATDMKHEFIDGQLHFYFKINYHIIKEIEEISKMNNLKKEIYLNGKSHNEI